ncbi:hypothetical protein SSS_02759 [Sarcoptes scabiei]|uniref:Uncharacterized protein n=1 Tax=Sarcoptes scabiei TaxID=52283 RepID=A0A834QY90_SARSC|nr:hypothetical protein SSS_02759 [Sarcoptes scabiei]
MSDMNSNKDFQEKRPVNMGRLLLERQTISSAVTAKKDVKAKSEQVPSTPSNIKRLQVNKWFNSPTDNLFSPCSKKLFNKKIVHPVHLLDEMKNCDQPNFDVENIESFDNDNDENISQ